MLEGLLCVVCHKPLVHKKMLSARYCNRKCRNQAIGIRRKLETLRGRNEPERILQEFAIWLTKFHLDLLRRAPAEAGGYRLGLWTGQMIYWFPSLLPHQSYRHTLHRTRTPNNFFSLSPFEPPVVPLATYYKVHYVQNIPPHPDLPELGEDWWEKVPYSIRHRVLPFKLKAVPREQR